MDFSFRIHASRADGTVNRRFHKIRYTAALRFGVVLPADRGSITLSFNGLPTSDVVPHGDNRAYCGQLSLDREVFEDVIVIARPRDSQRIELITFWPRSQHPDAHQSYTDPLVDTAMDGTPFEIDVVATRMYEAFRENAGASPATLMKLLYEEETEAVRGNAHRLAALLEASFEREREAGVALDGARAAREAAEAERDATQAKLVETTAEAEQAKSDRTELQELVAALRAQADNAILTNPKVPDDDEQTELKMPARPVTRQWRSRTKNSQYMNVGIDAYVEDVEDMRPERQQIRLTYIDSAGAPRKIVDFGFTNGFVGPVFDYLSRRKERRAVFLVTWKPGEQTRLASDTMMLDDYSHLWK